MDAEAAESRRRVSNTPTGFKHAFEQEKEKSSNSLTRVNFTAKFFSRNEKASRKRGPRKKYLDELPNLKM